MQKLILILLITNSLFAKDLTLAVSANVSFAIKELIQEFKKTNPKAKIKTVLGSSGKLNAQIKNHAPFDIFMSADMKYPQDIYKKGFALKKAEIYAKGSLVLFSRNKRDFSKGFELLKDKKIRRISIANPKTAPYGRASKEVLEALTLYKPLKNKFIYAESVSQSLVYSLKASDLGFIAKSSLFNKKLKRYKKDINWFEIDSSLYSPINQGIILLKKAKNKKVALDFYNFILSTKAKNILEKNGYLK